MKPDSSDTSAAARFLHLDDFGWIEGMEFRSRRRSHDLYSGRHRSSQLGGCTEFADHRPYYPGDPLRQMDWRLAGKRDRHYIKRFEDERTVSTLLVIDRSGSMAYGDGGRKKYLHALRAAACIARLLLGNRDPVGLASWNSDGDAIIVQPRSTPSHFEALFDRIGELDAEGETRLPKLIKTLIPLFPNRMRIVLLTDAFLDEQEIHKTLQSLAVRGHETILGHVLANEELNFEFADGMRFVDLEDPEEWLDVDPAVYREAYLQEFNGFLANLLEECTGLGCGYLRLDSSLSAGASISAFLRRWNAGSLSPVLGPDEPAVKR